LEFYDLIFYLSMLAGLLMAFSLGANDLANTMATAVGSKALTVRQAVMIAAPLTFVGAVFLGAHVTATITRGVVNPEHIADPKLMVLGMFSALLAAALWVFIASVASLPVSTTHSIVGSVLGFGIVAGGPEVVNWAILLVVVLSWLISPIFAGALAYLIFTHIRKFIFYQKHYLEQARIWAPRWIGLTVLILGFSFVFKTPLYDAIDMGVPFAVFLIVALACLAWAFFRYLINKITRHMEQNVENVEGIFRKLQIMTSSYVSLSLGANDVANAVGPVAVIYIIVRQQELVEQADIPIFLLVMGGLGIALGIALLGARVIRTVGTRITTLTHTRGFSVNYGSATAVLVASMLGMPVSTTHACVGGVTGVGLARGFSAIDLTVLLRIVAYWVLTVPIAALTCIVIFQTLRWTFVL